MVPKKFRLMTHNTSNLYYYCTSYIYEKLQNGHAFYIYGVVMYKHYQGKMASSALDMSCDKLICIHFLPAKVAFPL